MNALTKTITIGPDSINALLGLVTELDQRMSYFNAGEGEDYRRETPEREKTRNQSVALHSLLAQIGALS